MKSVTWLLALIVLVSGCSPGAADRTGDSSTTAGPAPAVGAVASAQRTVRPFADLADRGGLVEYATPVRRSGAYTWHAARLSETHAINAIVNGRMTVSAPDGSPITLRYDRHVEHADGNWTWVGTTADGGQAVITFGATAAFGSIPQGRGRLPLRLTTMDGLAWVVSTDRSALAAVHNEATDPVGPDYFVPPKLTAGLVSRTGMRPAAAAPAAAGATSTQIIDLLVGYTSGFASSVGGQAAARTRIQNLVDITNQAYANSRVDARVRLVHAMQVSYPDATENATALEEMTGFEAPSTRTTPAPAFAGLRNAREQYGADLVTLVRKFQTPENGGCGIAWLIGGGKTGIAHGDEFFGYSVVSDGQDAGTDGNYYCRDETLAHELGHNMGSQHDAATANDEPGLYDYSFGYKTVAGGDFYTVMAYGDDGQHGYRVFSNPEITYCGAQPCGVAGEADNARSLTQAMPVIAAFRASRWRSANADFNGDGVSDVLWRNVSTGGNTIWLSAARTTEQKVAAVPNLDWVMEGVGDFNGDAKDDILWRHRGNGANTIWSAGSNASEIAVARVSSLAWTIAGVGDFDGDQRADILWRNMRTGANTIWKAGDSSAEIPMAHVTDFDWTIAGVADFNSDGASDILWRNIASGGNTIWLSGNANSVKHVAHVADLDWTIAGVGDFDGDGYADILWRNRATGGNTIWRSADRSTEQAVTAVRSQAWQVAGVGDYDADGRSDILWRNMDSGANTVWRSANSATEMAMTRVANLAWTIQEWPTD